MLQVSGFAHVVPWTAAEAGFFLIRQLAAKFCSLLVYSDCRSGQYSLFHIDFRNEAGG